MSPLDRIEARRMLLRAEMAQTRQAMRASIGRLGGWLAPAAMALAAGRAVAGRPWLRLALIGASAAAAILRWTGRR